jgi:GTP-binding protein
MPTPVVVIIGRPNVGKSTLFNRVLGERRAVVDDRPGITRDRNAVRAEWTGRAFLLVDTGGFVPAASEGREAEVRRQAEAAIGLADVVVFLVDARSGATDLDGAIARTLRSRDCAALLVVNKVDKPLDPIVHDFHRLGLGEPIPISAEGGTGIGDLLDRIVARLPADTSEEETPAARIAIVGRPNVGKSSLVNALLGEVRMIVEPEPGTTLDPVDTLWRTPAGDLVLVDTAGIRRQAHFKEQAEFYAIVRALGALQRADLACLVIDSTEGFRRQEARLSHDALEAGCSVQLIYNKWDLVEAREQAWKDAMRERAERYPTLADLPAIPASALRGNHLQRLPQLMFDRIATHRRTIATRDLNAWLEDVQKKRQVPSNRVGKAPRIYYMTQTGTGPPAFTLFVNAPSRLSENYRRFLWLQFIRHFKFAGTPVRFRVRKSE